MHDFCLTIPYGMIVMFGGIIGFLAAGSRASLMAGGGSGALLMLLGYGGYMEYKAKGTVSQLWTIASLVISNVIWVMMAKRFRKTGKIMPSAPLGILALLMAFFYAYQMAKTTKANFKPAAQNGSATDKKES
ncbi:unnamed protein product [Ectocarpus sp. CCAP 1310/34]|nr:unnamed protein product [Ectocarpus sp. CCAP 1310/34]